MGLQFSQQDAVERLYSNKKYYKFVISLVSDSNRPPSDLDNSNEI